MDSTNTRQADNGLWWSFKTNPLPAKPSLLTPVTKTYTLNTTPELTWAAVPYGAAYTLEISTSKKFDVPPVQTYTGASLGYTVNPALIDGLYYWRVKAINSNNESGAWSSKIGRAHV